MRDMIRMRAHLAPWLVATVLAVAFLPLVLTGGCEIACGLGAMPAGTCGHSAMGSAHGHLSGEMLASAPLSQLPVLAAVLLVAAFAAMAGYGAAASLVASLAVMPCARDGTRLLI